MLTFFSSKYKRYISLSLLTFFLTLSFTSLAHASGKCGPRPDIVKQLDSTFKEKLHSRGLISDQLLMEVFVSSKGSWSVLFTSPKGRACVMATGKMWIVRKKEELKPEV